MKSIRNVSNHAWCTPIRLALLVAGLFLTWSGLAANPIEHWSRRSPLPHGTEMHDVAFGEGKFVAVAFGGIVITSTDGATWTRQYTGSAGHMYDVVFGNGRFVATQTRGDVLGVVVSDDGEAWTSYATPASFEGLGFADGLFVAGGWTGSEFAVYTSPNGANWTRRSRLPGQINQIIRVNGRYVATGNFGRIYSSPDLADWTIHQTAYDTSLPGLAYGNGVFVAIATGVGAMCSSDGAQWTTTLPGIGLWDVIFEQGQFVAVGDFQTATSTDGTNWVTQPMLTPPSGHRVIPRAIAYGNGTFTAVGSYGRVITSPNGTNWVLQSRGTVTALYSVIHTGTEWIALGDLAEVIASTNGADWVTRRSPLSGGSFFDVIHVNGMLVVVAVPGGWVYFSTNGSAWDEHFVSGFETGLGIAYGAGRWVLVGTRGNIWTSENTVDWTNRVSNTGLQLNQVLYAAGEFIAVGTGGAIVTSADGISWTPRSSGTSDHLNAVAYDEDHGLFVVVGAQGRVLTSTNRVQWTPAPSGTSQVLTDVAYGHGRFVAVGFGGLIATSLDGRTWRFLASPTDSHLFSVAFGDHSFLAVGEGGTIVQSDPFLELKLLRTPFPTLRLSGPRDRAVRIETVTELNGASSWQPAGTISLGAEPVLWSDPGGVHDPARFYRAILLP